MITTSRQSPSTLLIQKVQLQTPVLGSLSSINLKVINNLASNFMVHPEDNIAWFVESCNDSELSKTLFFFVLLQSLQLRNPEGLFSFCYFESPFSSSWKYYLTAQINIRVLYLEAIQKCLFRVVYLISLKLQTCSSRFCVLNLSKYSKIGLENDEYWLSFSIKGDGSPALFKSVFPILKAELEYLVNADVLLDEVWGVYSHACFYLSCFFLWFLTFFVCCGIACSSILKC